jgi:hypothetical protein
MHALGPKKFVRDCVEAGDIKTFDVGQLHVAAVSNGTPTVVGKLWLEYDIEFFVPQIEPSVPIGSTVAYFVRNDDQALTDETLVNWIPESTVVNPLGITYNAGTGAIALPKGVWLCSMEYLCSCSAAIDSYVAVEIEQDGGPLSPRVISYSRSNGSGTYATFVGGSITGVVKSDGTTEITFAFTPEFASGTMHIESLATRAWFRAI